MTDFHLYLSGRRAWLRRTHGMPWNKRVSDVATWDWGPGQSLGAVAGIPINRWTKSSLSVYAGSALCRMGVFPAPAGVRKEGDLAAIGRAALQHERDLKENSWRFSVDHTRGQIIACALRSEAFDAITTFANGSRLKLLSVRPFAAVLFNAFRRQHGGKFSGALLAVEADALSVIQTDGDRIVTARSMMHDGGSGVVRREVNRLRMRADGETDESLAILLETGCAWETKGLEDAVLSYSSAESSRHFADFRDLMFQGTMDKCD